ncbi:Cytochrome b561 and DOMON domain-containing protein [Psidium guajava]|nr:Cytochrome b561 and DOMON domain-containing protein [Psidium guajava]
MTTFAHPFRFIQVRQQAVAPEKLLTDLKLLWFSSSSSSSVSSELHRQFFTMHKTALPVALFILVTLCAPSFAAHAYKNHTFSNHRSYARCVDLPVLNSSLHWNYNRSSYALDMAFQHVGTTYSRWIAWAINPSGKGMIGSQALVAYQGSNNGSMRVYTSPVDSYATTLPEGTLKYRVSRMSATFEKESEMTIFATVHLTSDLVTINQVWQEGPLNGRGDGPSVHATSGDHITSVGTLNLVTGATS